MEAGLVGGECPFLACMPSKAVLRSAEARVEAGRLTELGAATVDAVLDSDDLGFRAAVRRRDEIVQGRDDSAAAEGLRSAGVELVRGRGRVVRPGVVAVDGRELAFTDLVLSTGSSPVRCTPRAASLRSSRRRSSSSPRAGRPTRQVSSRSLCSASSGTA